MTAQLPKTYKKLVIKNETTDFRKAVEIVSVPLKKPGDNEILVKNRYVGVNATDVNITGGRFYGGEKNVDVGLEAVGEIVAIGEKIKNFTIGQHVAYVSRNSYAEYSILPGITEDVLFPVPESKPEYVSLLISGLTASIGLDKSGRITEGETVLITAAAGGCGHIAVQWAKAAGCHVIATCSSEKKAKVLKDLGCDRIIDYKTEDLDQVLTKEYPKGINVVWETIGGKVFETCFKHLAVKGRLIIVGYITGYLNEGCPQVDLTTLPAQVLFKSSSVQGFLLLHYTECFQTYFDYLSERIDKKELQIVIDNGKESFGKEFQGLEGIIDGVDYLHSGKSTGKVVVKIA